MRGHTTIFQKIDYMFIFRADLQDTSGPWHLKKWSHKENFCAKVIFIPNDHFRNAQKKLIFTLSSKKGCKWKKRLGKQNFKKGGGMLTKGLGTLKRRGLWPLTNYDLIVNLQNYWLMSNWILSDFLTTSLKL